MHWCNIASLAKHSKTFQDILGCVRQWQKEIWVQNFWTYCPNLQYLRSSFTVSSWMILKLPKSTRRYLSTSGNHWQSKMANQGQPQILYMCMCVCETGKSWQIIYRFDIVICHLWEPISWWGDDGTFSLTSLAQQVFLRILWTSQSSSRPASAVLTLAACEPPFEVFRPHLDLTENGDLSDKYWSILMNIDK